MKKIFKILPLLLLSLFPLTSCNSPETNEDKCEVKFTLDREGVFVNIGFAIIGDFCNWGKVNEELSEDAIILELIDNNLYKGSKYFEKSTTIHYKLVEYGNNLLDNRIIEIEDVPERILTVNSDSVNIVLNWGEIN